MPNRLGNMAKRIVGTKQVLKHINQQSVSILYLALDADEFVKEQLKSAYEGQQLEIIEVATMQELGSLCGIDVGAACAALLK